MRTLTHRIIVPILALSSLAAAQVEPLAGLDDYIAHAMTTFQVPGIAVAIVKDGKVVLAKGYGVRKIGEPAKVDEHTLFGIASNTKAFTTAALAMLVDEGKIQWDTFKVRWRDRSLNADAFVTFSLNAEGGIKEVTMKPVSPLTDFSFDFQDLTIVPVQKK
jgi:hypothetical protein